jgi:8-oxo-dGTP pyrophosphatase MutT (NUDIX family)
MKEAFGFPVVDSTNVFEVLAELGIKPWPHTEPVISLSDYMERDLDDEQRAELRFAPVPEVVSLTDQSGKPFRGFRSKGKDWATVFALLPGDLLPIVGEYKHGADEVLLVPPSGVPSKAELAIDNPMLACAKREWEEETGLTLKTIEPLSDSPLIIAGRQSTLRYFPFLGSAAEPIVKGESKLDKTEHLKMVLIPLGEWLKVIANGKGVEDCAASITLLAMMRLGKI